MSEGINVISKTQMIIVDARSGTVSVISSGPPGPAGAKGSTGPTGPSGVPGGSSDWKFNREVGPVYTVNTQTYVDIANLVFPTEANKRYEFEAFLIAQSDINGLSFKFASTGVLVYLNYIITGGTTGTNVIQEMFNGIATNTSSYLTYAGSRGIIWIKGQCITNSITGAGNFSLQAAKTVSGTSSVIPGSNLRVREVNLA
jgi:hypothetical protein